MCEELRKRAASRGGDPQGASEGGGGGSAGGSEEDTFVSLRTSRRTLDLKFPTVPTRYVYLDVHFAAVTAANFVVFGGAAGWFVGRGFLVVKTKNAFCVIWEIYFVLLVGGGGVVGTLYGGCRTSPLHDFSGVFFFGNLE